MSHSYAVSQIEMGLTARLYLPTPKTVGLVKQGLRLAVHSNEISILINAMRPASANKFCASALFSTDFTTPNCLLCSRQPRPRFSIAVTPR